MDVEMKTYRCQDPEQNPPPPWLRRKGEPKEAPALDPVEQFKRNPDAFFPDFTVKKK